MFPWQMQSGQGRRSAGIVTNKIGEDPKIKILIWVGIIFCISHSAMLSGLNFAFFSIRKRRFEIESKKNDAHVFKGASGTSIPTYEIAGCTRKNFFFLAATILVGAVIVLGLTGCSSRTPKIYKMYPGNLERIRYNIRRVGVTISSYPVERPFKFALLKFLLPESLYGDLYV